MAHHFFSQGGFPGGFHHGHMGGGRGGGRGGRASGPVDTDKFYNLLGVDKTATKAQIRKAYLKKAQKEHPDKGGDEEKFKQMQKAYEVLFDEDKRELYDQGGEEAVENGGGHDDMMSQFFGGGGRQRGPQKGEDTETELGVSLEDLYKGKTTKIALNKSVYKVDPRGNVQDNRGRRLSKTTERKKLEIEIDRGMVEGQKITLSGEGDQIPGVEPGDMIIKIKEKKHATFQRKGADLYMRKKVSLCEALTGTSFTVQTLDKRTLFVKTKPGMVIGHKSLMQIEDEGMPMYRHPEQHGFLFVAFEIDFPETLKLSAAQRKALKGIIGSDDLPPIKIEAHMEEVELKEKDAEAAEQREQTRKHFSREDEDDSGEGHGQGGVQCAQQ